MKKGPGWSWRDDSVEKDTCHQAWLLLSIPEAHMVEESTDSCKLSSELHLHPAAHIYSQIKTKIK